jgi:hypothetical protein
VSKRQITCFMAEPTGNVRRFLRRYSLRNGTFTSDVCQKMPGKYSYHNAQNFLDEVPDKNDPSGNLWPHDDPRWPKQCGCGYEFMDEDDWQLFQDHVYYRKDTGARFALRDAEPGTMWNAEWFIRNGTGLMGPDGLSLVVKTPEGDWHIDGPSDTGGCWTRTGVPPKITARPSIGIGKPFRYHAFLTDGVLVDC